MKFTPRSEIVYMDEDPASGNVEICPEIRRALLGEKAGKPLAKSKKMGLKKWL